MDGDDHRKQHERLMARSGNAAARGRTTDPFESAMHPRGDPTGLSQPPERAQMSYDYGYTGSSFAGGSLQGNEVQSYPPEFARPRQTPSTSQQRRRAPEMPPFVPYEPAMLYGFGQQGPAQGPFEVVPQYPTRQSAAIEALSNQFPVPQYFTPEEPSGTGVPGLSPYLNAQLPYNQPGPMARPSTTQPFPATMTDFTPIGPAAAGRLDPPQQQTDSPQQPVADPSNLDEAYTQYRRALHSTFDHARAGRLVEASRSLLEISEWLVTNARDLGILRDDHLLYQDRLQLWNDFNLCWLAVCQKQKDISQDLIATGHPPAHMSLISRDRLEAMGKDLIQLCDQLEQYGLVDYQLGIWEEEILCVLGQCLDVIESRPELRRIPAMPEPATAVPRP
ncbi:hypothetical protein N7532_002460 [Penicillium argentinense]|uniref:Uncharacterized protein n=1 Tax=Penicillium argentinense TaxID=1131581 RepID=A0A9W9KKN0_9EURO|nr:uncharacterized protein N7532_002460 [Penicillium argentinense]KAJ5109815.1 hypothetical protein N7532_002460 [Penicillium argentinense]